MSIKESILHNTNLNAEKGSNFRGGSATSPLKSEILSKHTKSEMFSKVAFDYLSFTFPYSKFAPENFSFFEELLYLKNIPCMGSPLGAYGYSLSLRLEQSDQFQ